MFLLIFSLLFVGWFLIFISFLNIPFGVLAFSKLHVCFVYIFCCCCFCGCCCCCLFVFNFPSFSVSFALCAHKCVIALLFRFLSREHGLNDVITCDNVTATNRARIYSHLYTGAHIHTYALSTSTSIRTHAYTPNESESLLNSRTLHDQNAYTCVTHSSMKC